MKIRADIAKAFEEAATFGRTLFSGIDISGGGPFRHISREDMAVHEFPRPQEAWSGAIRGPATVSAVATMRRAVLPAPPDSVCFMRPQTDRDQEP